MREVSAKFPYNSRVMEYSLPDLQRVPHKHTATTAPDSTMAAEGHYATEFIDVESPVPTTALLTSTSPRGDTPIYAIAVPDGPTSHAAATAAASPTPTRSAATTAAVAAAEEKGATPEMLVELSIASDALAAARRRAANEEARAALDLLARRAPPPEEARIDWDREHATRDYDDKSHHIIGCSVVISIILLLALSVLAGEGSYNEYREVVYAAPGGYYQVHRETTLPSGLKYVSSSSPQTQREVHAEIPFPMISHFTSPCRTFWLNLCNNGTDDAQVQQRVYGINVERWSDDDEGSHDDLQSYVLFDANIVLQSGECRPERFSFKQSRSHLRVNSDKAESVASLYSVEQYVSYGDGRKLHTYVDSGPCEVDRYHVLVQDTRTSGIVLRQVSAGNNIFFNRKRRMDFFAMWVTCVAWIGVSIITCISRHTFKNCIIERKIRMLRNMR